MEGGANSGRRSNVSGKSIFAIAKAGLGVWAVITPPPHPLMDGRRDTEGGDDTSRGLDTAILADFGF